MIPFRRRHRFLGHTRGVGTPTWDEWLTLPAVELYSRTKQFGIRGVREAAIGHAYPMLPYWVQTVGMWGVCTKEEILDVLPDDMTHGAFRAYKHSWHLRTLAFEDDMDPSLMCFKVQQALMRGVGQEKYEVEWRIIGQEAGVLPVEAVLYDHAFQLLGIVGDLTPRKLLKVSEDRRRELWQTAGVIIRIPETKERRAA